MNRTKISFLLMLCITASSQALIVTTDSIETVAAACQQKSMLFIDLDETIGLRVFDPKLTKYWLSKVLLKPFELGFFDRLHFVQKLNPMEPSTLPLLKKLQDQHEPIMIITARPIEIAAQTELQLHNLGFDPSINNPIMGSEQITKNAVLKNGIIYCASQEKGPIVLAFLRNNNLTPDTVVYADNLLKHAKSVDETLTAAGIECLSFHYTREQSLPYFSSFGELF